MLYDGDSSADFDYDTVQARAAEYRRAHRSQGQNELFDDYCAAVRLLTAYANRPTLAERVQAALDERDRLQAELDADRLWIKEAKKLYEAKCEQVKQLQAGRG